jgi:hypothetical protein
MRMLELQQIAPLRPQGLRSERRQKSERPLKVWVRRLQETLYPQQRIQTLSKEGDKEYFNMKLILINLRLIKTSYGGSKS